MDPLTCMSCGRTIERTEDRWLYDSTGRELKPKDDLCEECFGKMASEGRSEMIGTFVHVRGLDEGTQICDDCGKPLEVAKLLLYAQRTFGKIPASRASHALIMSQLVGRTYTSEDLDADAYAVCVACDKFLTAEDIRAWSKP